MKWSDVLRKAGEMAKETYTSAKGADLINGALDKMEPLSMVTDGVSVTLSAGVTEYDVPTTLKSVSGVIFVRGDSEAPLSRLNWQNRYGVGYRLPPSKIQVQGITIQVGDKLLVVGPLKLPRVTVADLPTDPAESPEITIIPEEWQWLLESYCVWRRQQAEGWAAEAKEEEIRWLRGLDAFASSQFQSQVTGKLQRREYY